MAESEKKPARDIGQLEDELTELRRALERQTRAERSWALGLWRGVLFGIGSTLGVALILYIAILGLHQLEVVPGIGSLAGQVAPIIENTVSERVPTAAKLLPKRTSNITDPASLYKLNVPTDWVVKIQEGTDGTQRSYVEVTSPDFASRLDESTNAVYYTAGAQLSVQVVSEAEEKTYTTVLEENTIEVAGEPATYTMYRRGNTASGRLIDVVFQHNDDVYTLTFVYNPETYPNGEAVLEEILNSFAFTS